MEPKDTLTELADLATQLLNPFEKVVADLKRAIDGGDVFDYALPAVMLGIYGPAISTYLEAVRNAVKDLPTPTQEVTS